MQMNKNHFFFVRMLPRYICLLFDAYQLEWNEMQTYKQIVM